MRLNSNINTPNPEQDPYITAGGKSLYFASYGRPGGHGKYDIWVSEWDTVTGNWGPATNLGANINTGEWEDGPCLTTDGKTLYFFSDGLGDEGIFKSQWSGTGWGPAERLSGNVNWSLTEAPSISVDGLTLYYTRALIQGKQIYVSYWAGQDWKPGQFLTEANDTTGAAGPQISYDNRTLYFYSIRTQGSYGGHDIWMIRR